MKPNIRLKFLGANIFRTPDHTGIGTIARVWNLGEASAIPEWKLSIKLEGKEPVLIHNTPTPDTGVIVTGRPPVTLRHADDLAEKTATATVGKTPLQGHVLFYTSLAQAAILQPATVLEVQVEDIYGTIVKAAQRLGDWPSSRSR